MVLQIWMLLKWHYFYVNTKSPQFCCLTCVCAIMSGKCGKIRHKWKPNVTTLQSAENPRVILKIPQCWLLCLKQIVSEWWSPAVPAGLWWSDSGLELWLYKFSLDSLVSFNLRCSGSVWGMACVSDDRLPKRWWEFLPLFHCEELQDPPKFD